jgi:hypothetical protein
MTTPQHFGWFQNSDGSYNQPEIGKHEAQQGRPATPQLYDETRRDAELRDAANRAEQERMRQDQERRQGGGW